MSRRALTIVLSIAALAASAPTKNAARGIAHFDPPIFPPPDHGHSPHHPHDHHQRDLQGGATKMPPRHPPFGEDILSPFPGELPAPGAGHVHDSKPGMHSVRDIVTPFPGGMPDPCEGHHCGFHDGHHPGHPHKGSSTKPPHQPHFDKRDRELRRDPFGGDNILPPAAEDSTIEAGFEKRWELRPHPLRRSTKEPHEFHHLAGGAPYLPPKKPNIAKGGKRPSSEPTRPPKLSRDTTQGQEKRADLPPYGPVRPTKPRRKPVGGDPSIPPHNPHIGKGFDEEPPSPRHSPKFSRDTSNGEVDVNHGPFPPTRNHLGEKRDQTGDKFNINHGIIPPIRGHIRDKRDTVLGELDQGYTPPIGGHLQGKRDTLHTEMIAEEIVALPEDGHHGIESEVEKRYIPPKHFPLNGLPPAKQKPTPSVVPSPGSGLLRDDTSDAEFEAEKRSKGAQGSASGTKAPLSSPSANSPTLDRRAPVDQGNFDGAEIGEPDVGIAELPPAMIHAPDPPQHFGGKEHDPTPTEEGHLYRKRDHQLGKREYYPAESWLKGWRPVIHSSCPEAIVTKGIQDAECYNNVRVHHTTQDPGLQSFAVFKLESYYDNNQHIFGGGCTAYKCSLSKIIGWERDCGASVFSWDKSLPHQYDFGGIQEPMTGLLECETSDGLQQKKAGEWGCSKFEWPGSHS